MKVCGLNTTEINGEPYWTVAQFAILTNKKEQTIRYLILNGNRVRKLKAISIGGKPFVLASELFEYPFIVTGRPSKYGWGVVKYTLEKGELTQTEEKFDPCQ